MSVAVGSTSEAPQDGSPAADVEGAVHRYAQVGGIRMHYVEAGPADGPLVVLLHGFPEFWYSWRRQIPTLAAAGLHVVAPDMRGYNLTEKPKGWRKYRTDELSDDIAALIRSFGVEQTYLAGHDWGAAVAYATTMRHPGCVKKLAILNVPHTARMLAGFRTLKQLRKSWYMFMFQLPVLPEWGIARDGYSAGKRSLRAGAKQGTFSDEDLERYAEAWSKPGALTGMVNYYRAALRQSPGKALAELRPFSNQTLVIWGKKDMYLGSELAEPEAKWVPNARVEWIPDATHWVQHEAAERVNELLIGFFQDS